MAGTPVNESKVVTDLLQDLPITREATTSRVVVNNDVLRHVVFAFDAGQILTEHTSPRAVVVTLLTGKMDFEVGGESNILGPGDVIYLAPGAPHAVTALEPSHMALTMVDVTDTEHAPPRRHS